MRVESASMASGVPGSTTVSIDRPFFSTWTESVSVVPSISARSENGASSSSMRPASIFEKSSTSSMMRKSAAAELRTVPTRRFCRSFKGSRSRSSAVPTTPFIGVRISWLMVARKVDFAWLAASASSRAAFSRSSCSTISVMSRWMVSTRPSLRRR